MEVAIEAINLDEDVEAVSNRVPVFRLGSVNLPERSSSCATAHGWNAAMKEDFFTVRDGAICLLTALTLLAIGRRRCSLR